MTKLLPFLLAFFLLSIAAAPPVGAAADDPRIRVLLEEGLRLYSERQYVRALDLFKQVQRIDPANPTADEYIKSSEQRILEWEAQGTGTPSGGKANPTWDSLLDERRTTGVQTNANDIIAARRSLVERMRNRSSNTDNIVQIEDTKNGLDVTLFHDQLFLPGLSTLRDEALPILENVADLIRQKGDREVRIVSVAHTNSEDPYLLFPEAEATGVSPDLPQMKPAGSSLLLQDIELTRSLILFTHLAERSMGRTNPLP